jgi:hypothetical protein
MVAVCSLPVPILCNYYFAEQGVLIKFLTTGFACVLSVGASTWLLGVNKMEKQKIVSIVKSKFFKRRNGNA